MKLRRVLFWSHLSMGIVVGIVVAFLAATGLLLAFQSEVIALTERSYRIQQPSSNNCINVSELLSSVEQIKARRATSFTIFVDPAKPAEIAFGHEETVLLHPCTGAILATDTSWRSFFWKVRELHRAITLQGIEHPSLRKIKDAANLGFAFLIVTGLVIWLPRKFSWQHLRPIMVLRTKASGRARNWNWHNVAGIWFAIPLLFISATGAIMSYQWANALLYRIAGDTLPQRMEHEGRDSLSIPQKQYPLLNTALASAIHADATWKSIEMQIPSAKSKTIAFTIEEGEIGKPQQRVRLQVKRSTGEVTKVEHFENNTRGRRWRLYARFLHTGELFGFEGKFIAFSAALSLLALVWTGFALSIHRYRNWRTRMQNLKKRNRWAVKCISTESSFLVDMIGLVILEPL